MQTNNNGGSELTDEVNGGTKNEFNDIERDDNESRQEQIVGNSNCQQASARLSPSPINNQISQSQRNMREESSLNSSASGAGQPMNSHNLDEHQASHQLPGAGSSHHQNQQQRRHVSSNYHPNHQPNLYHHSQHHHHHDRSNGPRVDDEVNVNHVLLITVINPHYPINCNLIHQICSNHGKVNRIVIFKKNGVQAMVEFDDIESAKRAKSMLSGCDIYSGCCTLRIDYAKPTRLNIHRNGLDSYDYTNPSLPSGRSNDIASDSNLDEQSGVMSHHQVMTGHMMHHQAHHAGSSHSANHNQRVLGSNGRNQFDHGMSGHHYHPQHRSRRQHAVLAYGICPIVESSQSNNDTFHHQDASYNIHRGGMVPSNYVGVESYPPHSHGATPNSEDPHNITGNPYQRQASGHSASHHLGQQQNHHHHMRSNHSVNGQPYSATNTMLGGLIRSRRIPWPVMMVYELRPDRVNCDRLFNLLCLYGNVSKIKFLKSKEGCAMVQMGDGAAVERSVDCLNEAILFDNILQISFSKQPFLHDVVQPFLLPDATPSFKDYQGNKNNRFKNPEVASKNRILPPSRVLHFFNAPHGITEDELSFLFRENANCEPVSIKMFSSKAENSKSFSGLAFFKDAAEATEALVICNHLSIPRAGAPHPYILRLCFSPPSQYNKYL